MHPCFAEEVRAGHRSGDEVDSIGGANRFRQHLAKSSGLFFRNVVVGGPRVPIRTIDIAKADIVKDPTLCLLERQPVCSDLHHVPRRHESGDELSPKSGGGTVKNHALGVKE